MFRHEIIHDLQGGRCSSRTRSEWGAEYNSGSFYYCFKVDNEWVRASEVAQIMRNNGCSETTIQSMALCQSNTCTFSAIEVKGTVYVSC